MIPTDSPTCLILTECAYGNVVSVIPLGNATLTPDERKTLDKIASLQNMSVQVLACENHPSRFRDITDFVRSL
jgi:hypothetical protein